VQDPLLAFGAAEGKFPEAWAGFFKTLDSLEDPAVGLLACRRVLSAVVWGSEAAARKSVQHNFAYADVTMFMRNFGAYANDFVRTEAGMKVKAEATTAAIVQASDTYHCFRCNATSHVNSQCFVKKRNMPQEDKERGAGGFRDRFNKGYPRDRRDDQRDRLSRDRR
jgi:hypothetical protein